MRTKAKDIADIFQIFLVTMFKQLWRFREHRAYVADKHDRAGMIFRSVSSTGERRLERSML